LTRKALAAPSLALALLGGCTLEPAYQRPALPTPAAFPDAQAGGTAVVPASASQGWQTFFVDPKLRATIQLALDNNRDLRVAIANIEASRALYRVQRAALLPTVTASAGVAYGRQQTLSATGAVVPYQEHQYSASVGASSYEVDLFGRVRSLSHAALETYLATEEAHQAAQITIISETATDYLTLSADQAILQAAKDTLTSSAASLDVAQKRFDHGIASALDISQAQTIVQQARADVAADTTLVAQDKNALDLVVGASVPQTLLPAMMDDRLMVMTDLPPGLPSDVLLSRPDVLQAEHQLKSANAEIGAARAAFFPTISLTGSGGATSASLSNLFKGASGVWSFAPQVSVPLFAGGANRANLDYAKAERVVYVAQYEKAIQSAFRDVANALARRATIAEQEAADEAYVAASNDALRLAEARYERGADTYLNVLTAQRTLYAAQQALDNTRLIRSTNLVSLYQALGGGVR
jgi:multidrug efflux system outer membrane protein